MPAAPAMLSDEHPLDVRDPARVRALDAVLRRHTFTPWAILEALEEDAGATLKRVELPLYLRRLRDAPLHYLIRLFLLGVPVELERAAAALDPIAPETLVELGLARAEDGHLISPYRLMVYEDFFLVCDRYLEGEPLRPDHVTGVNNSSMNLAALTVRQGGRALDIGTGCGVQALLASRHCSSVVATDVSARALNMTQFNAALNGVANIETRQGSFFEPVAGEEFDLITCNPPYVISPRADYVFRDAGLRGDTIGRVVVEQAARHLRPGGFATVLCDWAYTPYGDWAGPPRSWLSGTECSALILAHHSATPLEYAATWTRRPAPSDAATLEQRLEEWLEYYAELNIEAISSGAVVLRRSAEPRWAHAEMIPSGRSGPGSDHLKRMFAAQDYVRRLPRPSAALDTVFMPADGLIHQSLVYQNGEWQMQETRVGVTRGLGFEGRIDALALHLLMSLDGRRRLGPVIAQVARESELDSSEIVHDLLRVLLRWVELGVVVPVPREARG